MGLLDPYEWVERVSNAVRWTAMPAGGHFAALKQSRLLAQNIHDSVGGAA